MTRKGLILLPFLLVALAATPAWAGNGHFLHGIGAVNSSMGGAGVALPIDTLGALHLNPALLTGFEGHQFAFSVEQATASNAVESTVPTPFGPVSGRTEEDGDPALIPAFGWLRHKDGARVAFGMGFLGLAGFGVDYPQDPGNPILAPQPFGFGRVFSNYQILRVPVAFAWQINPRFSLGVSLSAARATLTADPAGFASPDCSGPAGPCFVPRVNNDSAWGFGGSVGLYYRVNDLLALGASYTLEQEFEDFEWNATVANPNLPNFGAGRQIEFQLNSPATLVAGIGLTPTDRLKIAIDGKMINYEDTEGFGGSGIDPATGRARGLGWEDITVIAAGLQFQATSRLALRLGYNASESPIPDQAAFFNVSSPAIFEDHLTAGFGFKVNDALSADLAYYRAFSNEITGPFIDPARGPVPGTQVTNEMELDGLVATFRFGL